MPYSFDQANEAFRDDRIRELGQAPEGLRFLKLRSLSKKDYMARLFEICHLPLPSARSKDWLKYLYENSKVTDDIIDGAINAIFSEERRDRQKPDLWQKIGDHPSSRAGDLVDGLKTVRLDILENAKNAPEVLARWLYENQGFRRFDASNRLYLVLVDLNHFFESWKLKRAKPLLFQKIHTHLDQIDDRPGFDLEFDWEGRNYVTTCDIIFITHKR